MMNDPIMRAILLRKGDGNYGLFGGKLHAFRYPPPESHVEDPNMPDVPAFAHTGGHGEKETGIPGTGTVIPGEWAKGRHGENVWVDKSGGEHMHGMDGIIRAVGDSMLEHGLNVPAKDIVQKAIDDHNGDKHKSEHVPNVDDPAWMKLHLAPFDEGGSIRGPNGELITTYTNRHGDNHALGTFLESYSNPIHKHLGQAMAEAGHPNAGKHSWVKRPYIKPHRLHYVPDGEGGLKSGVLPMGSGEASTRRGIIRVPPHHMLASKGERMFQNISSFGTAHHFPPPYYLNQLDTTDQAPTKLRPKTLASFVHHMKQALGHDPEAIANNVIVDHSAARKYIAGLSGDIDGVPLKALLSSGADEDLLKVANALQGYPAFQAIYGDNPKPGFLEDGSLNPKRRGSTVGKLHHYYGSKYGDDAPEGQGLDKYMSHSQRIEAKHLYRPGIATGDTRTMGGHARSLDHWSNVLLAASMGINHADHDLSPDDLRNAGIMLHDTDDERAKVPEVKALIDSLNPINLIARGIETKEIPSQQELEELAPYVNDVLHGGRSEDKAMMGVPDHIRYIDSPNPMVSSSPPIAPNKTTLHGEPAGVSGAPLPQTQGGAPAATVAPPPPSVAVRQTQVDPATPGLTQAQQMRAQFGHADPRTVQRVMADPAMNQSRYLDTGEAAPSYPPQVGLPTDEPSQGQDPAQWGRTGLGTPEAAARMREQQFQSSMGDPWQTRFITDYTKSDDNPEAAKDRLIKAVEILQIEDAKKDDEIIKHVSNMNMSSRSTDDIHLIAQKMDIAPIDVHTILNTKGDWKRISKRYGYQDEVVKVVKVSFGGV